MCLVIIRLDKIAWRHRMKSFEKSVSHAKERNKMMCYISSNMCKKNKCL